MTVQFIGGPAHGDIRAVRGAYIRGHAEYLVPASGPLVPIAGTSSDALMPAPTIHRYRIEEFSWSGKWVYAFVHEDLSGVDGLHYLRAVERYFELLSRCLGWRSPAPRLSARWMSTAIKRIAHLHRPDPAHSGWCQDCDRPWPCATIRLLKEERPS